MGRKHLLVFIPTTLVGLTLGVVSLAEENADAGLETRALLTHNLSVQYEGRDVRLRDAYLTDTSAQLVKDACLNGVHPAMPTEQRNGDISKPILRLDISGEEVCIVSGDSQELDGLDVKVLHVSGEALGESHYSKVSITDPPGWSDHFLEVLSSLLLGIAVGVIVPAYRELRQVPGPAGPRTPTPTPTPALPPPP